MLYNKGFFRTIIGIRRDIFHNGNMLRKSQSNLDTNLEIMRLFYDPIARDPAIKYAHNRAQTARRSLIWGRAEPAWPCIKTKPGKRAFVRKQRGRVCGEYAVSLIGKPENRLNFSISDLTKWEKKLYLLISRAENR